MNATAVFLGALTAAAVCNGVAIAAVGVGMLSDRRKARQDAARLAVREAALDRLVAAEAPEVIEEAEAILEADR